MKMKRFLVSGLAVFVLVVLGSCDLLDTCFLKFENNHPTYLVTKLQIHNDTENKYDLDDDYSDYPQGEGYVFGQRYNGDCKYTVTVTVKDVAAPLTKTFTLVKGEDNYVISLEPDGKLNFYRE